MDHFDELAFVPGSVSTMGKIVKELDYKPVMINSRDNSSGENIFNLIQEIILEIFKSERVYFDKIIIEHSESKVQTQKQAGQIFQKYIDGSYDLKNTYLISGCQTDFQLARDLGCKSILLTSSTSKTGAKEESGVDFTAENWDGIYQFLKNESSSAVIKRKTSETNIEVKLSIYGSGKSCISTGLSFFDHMLEQLARHGNMDLEINAAGDLEVDEHHTIEDVAIALGDAFEQALGNKRGIERYGFLLPMDDSLAQVAVDFGGRPWLIWEADFKREKIGDMPTEMFRHFFKSFSDHAKCNMNIKAEGANEHHKIEAIFKGFARAIKMGVKKTGNANLPSTKGVL
jgi:imidazoleglycerol-phosphate dehydratase/histidinol-phosphatase